MRRSILLSFLCLLFTYCDSPSQQTHSISNKKSSQDSLKTASLQADSLTAEDEIEYQEDPWGYDVQTTPLPAFRAFSRDSMEARLAQKVAKGEPLVAHLLVPLCDNAHQGIVPVSAALGDGDNLKSNLYWGAGYGIKYHFSQNTDWELLYSQKDISPVILERILLYKEFENGAKVYFVADAYLGERMDSCLVDYFDALVDKKRGKIQLDSVELSLYAGADLLGFNGHNGLMDTRIDFPVNREASPKDAVVIGCISYDYFREPLNATAAYPLVTTTNLMAPEAYVMEAVLDSWAMLESGEEVRLSAGDGYNRIQKCGQRGARRLLRSGW